MNTGSVDSYLADGCGRCDHYRTVACKVHRRPDVLVALRRILLDAGLEEQLKWGSPCYTLDGKNVAMLSALNDFCAVGFFKGVLLPDPEGLLKKPGPNTQAARQAQFTTADEVATHAEAVAALVRAAIEVERSGATVDFAPSPEPMPAALEALLDGDPVVAAAFEALTPGRQRSYILHVSGAKQEGTQARRAEKCVPKILTGKGFNER